MPLPRFARRLVALALIGSPLFAALRAGADEAAVEGAASASVSVSASVSATPAPVPSPPTPPPATTTSPAEAEPIKPVETTDHALVLGHFGFGYFGQYDAAIGVTRSTGSVPIQMVGIQHWFSRVRLDLAIGLGLSSGSSSATINGGDTVSTDDASLLAFGGRIALPVALWVDKHYTVFAGPEVVYAHAGETIPAPAPTPGATPAADTTHLGDRFTLGVRAGAEVQFGFIGLPRLALDASLGVALDYTSTKSSGTLTTAAPGVPSGGTFVRKANRLSVASSTSHQPWNIFITNVAAVYYF